MLDGEHLIIFHYDGEVEFELNCPQYMGGRQKMRYLLSSVTLNELCKIALEASSWATTFDQITIKYLLHNGRFFSMIDIDDDNDINGLFKSSKNEAKGILLFVLRRLCDEGTFQHNHGNRYVLKLKLYFKPWQYVCSEVIFFVITPYCRSV